jgi:hypothetical protein
VVLTVFVASVLVLVLGGFLLMQQATIGVIDGKKEAAKNEARQAVNSAQQQLNAADLTGNVNVDNLLLDLATGFASRAEQFEVIIVARGTTITAGNAVGRIPSALSRQVEQSVRNDLLMTPTQIDYRRRDLDPPRHRSLPDLPDVPPHTGGRHPHRSALRGGHNWGHLGDLADLHRGAGQPSGRYPGARRPSGR